MIEKYFKYLDRLRESGVTNMWGAGTYLEKRFKLKPKQANYVLGEWMRTFNHEITAETRALMYLKGDHEV